MSKLTAKIRHELGELLPPTLFFFITLTLIALVRALMLRGTGIPLSTPAQIALAALVMGKAVLLADLLPMINRYPDKPLAYNVAWKTAIYVLVSMVIHYLEHLIDFWKHADGFLAANRELLAHIVWAHFWAIQILLTGLILAYCTGHELIRVLGRRKVLDMFLAPPPKPGG